MQEVFPEFNLLLMLHEFRYIIVNGEYLNSDRFKKKKHHSMLLTRAHEALK